MCVCGLVEHQRMCEEIPAHKRVAQPLTASWREWGCWAIGGVKDTCSGARVWHMM